MKTVMFVVCVCVCVSVPALIDCCRCESLEILQGPIRNHWLSHNLHRLGRTHDVLVVEFKVR